MGERRKNARIGWLGMCVAVYSMALPVQAAFMVEAHSSGLANENFTSLYGSPFNSIPSTAIATTATNSVFGGDGDGPDTYIYSYTPGTDADNVTLPAGIDLGNGDLATGLTGGASGLYNVYITWPTSSGVNTAGCRITITSDESDIVLDPVDMNTGYTGDPGGNNAWLRIAENILLTQGNTYTVTQVANSDAWISQRSHGVLWEKTVVPEPDLLLTSPNGGEEFLSGTIHTIQWETTGVISNVRIEYSIDNGSNWTEVNPPNVGNTDTYDWTVPAVTSDQCLVRIIDADNVVMSDTSDDVFKIYALNLLCPNGGEKLIMDSWYPIKWTSSPLTSTHDIKIETSSDSGQSWDELVTTANTGKYDWQIPDVESNQYLVKVSDVTDPNNNDTSDDTFVIYTCNELIIGDLNLDCCVNLLDWALMAQNWLQRIYVKLYDLPLDNNPHWTTEGEEWAFGQPTGNGGDFYGNPDPNSGYTGTIVYGVNLNGDYGTDEGGPYYLTAGPFNCRHYDNMKLKFARWLNSDASDYITNMIEVSNDGSAWQRIWENTSEITDENWQEVEYDISNVADDQETVYIRWGYEVLERAYPYSGWNIDDVELWGNP